MGLSFEKPKSSARPVPPLNQSLAERRTKEPFSEEAFLNQARDCGIIAYVELAKFGRTMKTENLTPERENEINQKLRISERLKGLDRSVQEAIKLGAFCFGHFCLSAQGTVIEDLDKYVQETKSGQEVEEPIKTPSEYIARIKEFIEKELVKIRKSQPVSQARLQKTGLSHKLYGYSHLEEDYQESHQARKNMALAHLTAFGQAAKQLGDKEAYLLVSRTLDELLRSL